MGRRARARAFAGLGQLSSTPRLLQREKAGIPCPAGAALSQGARKGAQALQKKAGQEIENHALYAADEAFMDALRDMNSTGRDAADMPSFEAAAATFSKLALESGDDLKLCVLFSQFDLFVQSGRVPPRSMLVAINDAFSRFRAGGTSLDRAFGLGRERRGNHSKWITRQWGLQQAAMVEREREKGCSLEEAIGKVSDYFAISAENPRAIDPPAHSESQVMHNYRRYVKFIKSK